MNESNEIKRKAKIFSFFIYFSESMFALKISSYSIVSPIHYPFFKHWINAFFAIWSILFTTVVPAFEHFKIVYSWMRQDKLEEIKINYKCVYFKQDFLLLTWSYFLHFFSFWLRNETTFFQVVGLLLTFLIHWVKRK